MNNPIIRWSEEYQRHYKIYFSPASNQWNTAWLPTGWTDSNNLAPAASSSRRDSALTSGSSSNSILSPEHVGYAHYPSGPHAEATQASQVLKGYPTDHTPKYLGYVPTSSANPITQQYEKVDPTFRVRNKHFFTVGKVIAVIMNETAGHTMGPAFVNGSHSLTKVKYEDNIVYTNIRRFVIVQIKHEFCFACPIYTYSGRATLKRGTRPSAHAIAFTQGTTPQLLAGEVGITKPSFPVVMAPNVPPLDVASRIYFGIHHPIQYNIKVKEIGFVPNRYKSLLIGSWKQEDEDYNTQYGESLASSINDINELTIGSACAVAQSGNDEDEKDEVSSDSDDGLNAGYAAIHTAIPNVDQRAQPTAYIREQRYSTPSHLLASLQLVQNPRAFFKKGRVFDTLWATHVDESGCYNLQITRFTVIRAKTTHSVALPLRSDDSSQAIAIGRASEHAAVVRHDNQEGQLPGLSRNPILVKVENVNTTLVHYTTIDFAKPYSIDHSVQVQNVGRVFGESVADLDLYFADSLGMIKL